MNILVGNLVYGFCVFVAMLFVAGACAVVVGGLGESPLMAAGFALALALLCYGFGWSGRCLLQGR